MGRKSEDSLPITKNLTDHIMEPLDALAEGAKRVKENDLAQDIAYTGELEFD